jgi:hypothetical protein
VPDGGLDIADAAEEARSEAANASMTGVRMVKLSFALIAPHPQGLGQLPTRRLAHHVRWLTAGRRMWLL